MSSNSEETATLPRISVDVLVVGTGPAGASLACFLATLGRELSFMGRITD